MINVMWIILWLLGFLGFYILVKKGYYKIFFIWGITYARPWMALPEFALKAGREQYSWEMSPQVPGVVAKGCQKNVRLTYAEVLLLQNYVKAGVQIVINLGSDTFGNPIFQKGLLNLPFPRLMYVMYANAL